MKKISVLGSTGSIGVQTLTVAEKHGFEVVALAAGGRNLDLLEKQARKFSPKVVAVLNENAANDLKVRLGDTNITVLGGEESIVYAAGIECDIVLNAIVGIAGLKPTMAAINAGHDIALANKETLVTGGHLVMAAAREKGVKIYPVDSEHSAIFQSLQGTPDKTPFKIILTASGGPFFGKTRAELENIKPEDALKHPNWDMGKKITIDSATLMNKGLEVIEAVHLFSVSAKDIEVVVHRQSILHSAVEFCDGAVVGQFGTPDMSIPIQYALTYPNRYDSPAERMSFTKVGNLTFEKPDIETFVCLPTCINAIEKGGLYPAIANGANEKAVELFLDGKIGFLDIGDLVSEVTQMGNFKKDYTLEDVFLADEFARETVLKLSSK